MAFVSATQLPGSQDLSPLCVSSHCLWLAAGGWHCVGSGTALKSLWFTIQRTNHFCCLPVPSLLFLFALQSKLLLFLTYSSRRCLLGSPTATDRKKKKKKQSRVCHKYALLKQSHGSTQWGASQPPLCRQLATDAWVCLPMWEVGLSRTFLEPTPYILFIFFSPHIF